MSNKNVLYVKGMDISESEENDEDMWDDSKLNDAYDKALKVANAEVAKRVAMSTNSKTKPGVQSTDTKHKKSSSKKNASATEWKPGMPCRAIYEADGEEYEAFILRLVDDNECVVKFVGYDNTEVIQMKTLKPSKGDLERSQQIEQALNETGDNSINSQSPPPFETIYERIPGPINTDKQQKKKKSHKKKKNSNHSEMNGFVTPELPFAMPNLGALRNLGPLPPTPPPPLPRGALADCEEQAVSSMLLSWYMSGYYTGLYQGLKRAKESSKQ